MRTFILGVLIVVALLATPSATAKACETLTFDGWAADTDCDTVPDSYDNCPWDPNSNQYDRNRNGVGDICDLVIEYITVSPDNHLQQGEFGKLSISLINNRDGPLEDITVKVSSDALEGEELRVLESIPAGEETRIDLWIQIPKCAPTGPQELTVTSSFFEPITGSRSTEVQYHTLLVEASDLCGSPDGPLDNSIIEILGEITIDRNENGLIPINIMNFNPQAETYHVMVEDLGTWGTWRIDPSASVTVPPGRVSTLYLFVETEEFTPAGTKTLEVTVSSEEQRTTTLVNVYVRAPYERAWAAGTFMIELIFIILVVLIVIFLMILAVMHFLHRHKREKRATAKAKKTRKTTRKKARKKVAVQNVRKQKRATYY